MRCANCGSEIRVGSVYCSVCGREAQLVSESNLLEDDVLKNMLAEKRTSRPEEIQNNSARVVKKNNSHKKLWITLTICVFIVLIATALYLYNIKLKYDRENSYDYQFQLGKEAEATKDYDGAIALYNKAMLLNTDSIEVRYALARAYMATDDIENTVQILNEIIIYDNTEVEAFKQLIEIYADRNAFEDIIDLREKAGNADVQELFDAYSVAAPEFSIEEGSYTDDITVELVADRGTEIYYTLNEESPIDYGSLYTGPIQLDREGTYTIEAVAVDEHGIYSKVVSGIYIISFTEPAPATASLPSGNYTEQQDIVLNIPEGCTAYYTWDGSAPTTDSAKYTAPIPMEIGNNVLSVVVVDKHGLFSRIARYNYKYIP